LGVGLSFSAAAQVTNLGANFEANGVSNQGMAVSGSIGNSNLLWTQATGLQVIGSITNGFPMAGRATISADGLKISATLTNPATNFNEAGLYNVTTSSWTFLGGLGQVLDSSTSSAWGTSSDGNTVVGLAWVTGGNAHGFKWTNAIGLEDLGSSVANRSSRANDVNADGSIIVGWQDGLDGFRQAAVWNNGVQTVLSFPNNDPVSEAGAVSANGNWVVGSGNFSNNNEAWRWSESTGIINMGSIFDPSWRGAATAINADGSKIVGFYRPNGPALFGQGFFWSEETGMVNLNDYVTSLGFDDLGIILSLPLGMSDDGTAIVGMGLGAAGPVGFLIQLPSEGIANNNCSGAIALICDETVIGSTVGASDSGGNIAPDVFYSYTGNGVAENITISLCGPGTNFDSFLRIFTDCTLTTEVTTNDDFCNEQSEVTFESDGTSSYIIMVEGFNAESGDFELTVTCGILGVSDYTLNSIVLYPNPTKEILNLSSNIEIDHIEIYTISGQLVLSKTIQNTSSIISISSLKRGVYIAKAISKNASKSFKVIKE